MPEISLSAKLLLGILLGTLLLSLVLLAAEIVRAKDLSPAQKAGWVIALAVGSFFTAVIYFAQGRTARLGRIAIISMALAIALALGTIVVLVLRL